MITTAEEIKALRDRFHSFSEEMMAQLLEFAVRSAEDQQRIAHLTKLAGTDNSDSPDSQKPQEGQN